MAAIGKLSEALDKKAALEKLQAELAELEKSEEYKKEAALLQDLEELLDKHSLGDQDLVDVLSARTDGLKIRKRGGTSGSSAHGPKTRARRQAYQVKHPKTGATEWFKGGNPKWLKQWKDECGADAVKKAIEEGKANAGLI